MSATFHQDWPRTLGSHLQGALVSLAEEHQTSRLVLDASRPEWTTGVSELNRVLIDWAAANSDSLKDLFSVRSVEGADEGAVDTQKTSPVPPERFFLEAGDTIRESLSSAISGRRLEAGELLTFVSEGFDVLQRLQEWDGEVEAIDDTTGMFTARLKDRTGGGPDEFAQIPISEVDSSDRKLLVPGAAFFWVIGYHRRRGTRSRMSVLRFRRLPLPPELVRVSREDGRMRAARLGWSDD